MKNSPTGSIAGIHLGNQKPLVIGRGSEKVPVLPSASPLDSNLRTTGVGFHTGKTGFLALIGACSINGRMGLETMIRPIPLCGHPCGRTRHYALSEIPLEVDVACALLWTVESPNPSRSCAIVL